MIENNNEYFKHNDRYLRPYEIIVIILTVLFGIFVLIEGILMLSAEPPLVWIAFLIWIIGGFLVFVFWVASQVFIAFLRDVKFIRNKLYNIPNFYIYPNKGMTADDYNKIKEDILKEFNISKNSGTDKNNDADVNKAVSKNGSDSTDAEKPVCRWEIMDEYSAEITDCIGSPGSVKIPDSINGRAVTSIGFGAFSNLTSLKSVFIPKSIKIIKRSAFAGCTALRDIYFEGTGDEWERIEKDSEWDLGCREYKVHCIFD